MKGENGKVKGFIHPLRASRSSTLSQGDKERGKVKGLEFREVNVEE